MTEHTEYPQKTYRMFTENPHDIRAKPTEYSQKTSSTSKEN